MEYEASEVRHVIEDDGLEDPRSATPTEKIHSNGHHDPFVQFDGNFDSSKFENVMKKESMTGLDNIIRKDILTKRFLKYNMLLVHTGATLLEKEARYLRNELMSINTYTDQHSLPSSSSDQSSCKRNKHHLVSRNSPNLEMNVSDDSGVFCVSGGKGMIESSFSKKSEPYIQSIKCNECSLKCTTSKMTFKCGTKRKSEDISNDMDDRKNSYLYNDTKPVSKRLEENKGKHLSDYSKHNDNDHGQIGSGEHPSEKEKERLWVRLERMKKMAILLGHMDRLQRSFVKEVLEFMDDIDDQEKEFNHEVY